MSAADMPGLEASDGHQATPAPPATENAPQGLDDAALGGPGAWAAICDRLAGEGPTPPPCQPPTRLSGIEARLDEFGWQVRPCSTGGYFAWCPTGTQYCATWRELGAFASKVKYAARKAAAEVKKPTEPTPVMSRSEQKNAARNRRVELKAAFMDCLARVLARTTARRDDQQAGGAS